MSDKLQLLREEEEILRELGKKKELAFVLGSQADALKSRGQIREALQRLEEAEGLFRELHHNLGIEKALLDQVALLQSTEDNVHVLEVLQRQESLYRETGEQEELAECLFNQMLAVHNLNDLRWEVQLCEMQIPLWRSLQNNEKVACCCGTASMSLMQLSIDAERSLALAEDCVQASIASKDPLQISRAMNTKAVVLFGMGRHRESLKNCIKSIQTAKTNGIAQWVEMNQTLLTRLLHLQIDAIVEQCMKFDFSGAKEQLVDVEEGSELCANAETRKIIAQTSSVLRGIS